MILCSLYKGLPIKKLIVLILWKFRLLDPVSKGIPTLEELTEIFNLIKLIL